MSVGAFPTIVDFAVTDDEVKPDVAVLGWGNLMVNIWDQMQNKSSGSRRLFVN